MPAAQCQRPCHYCGGKAGTRDHVVPRSLLNRTQRYMGQITNNSVPACASCNQAKGSKRVIDCCEFCDSRWALYGPMNYVDRVPTVEMAVITRAARLAAAV